MTYVCIENNTVVSVLNYEPHVPSTVQVVKITQDQAKQLNDRTHYFDVLDSSVKAMPDHVLRTQEQAAQNAQAKAFLQNTDWQVLRHLRQQHLGVNTSLSDSEYHQLELNRQQAALSIKS
jgi:hypothetical protein